MRPSNDDDRNARRRAGRDEHRYPRREKARRPPTATVRESAVEAARRRMLDAYPAMRRARTNEAWDVWQAAAVDYYLLCHPEATSGRRPEDGHAPTLSEMVLRADALNTLRRTQGGDGSPAPDDVERIAMSGWFHELYAGLFGPVGASRAAVRGGDLAGVEILVRFLEADVYCFGSGYAKADVVDLLKRVPLDDRTAARLRRVVLAIVDGYDRREFRAYVRLARAVDSPDLRTSLEARLGDPSPKVRRHARWMLEGLRR